MDKTDKLTILSRQDDVVSLYNEASLVLNLSDKNKFIETFGLTALEAMSAGLPVIVPTVGGIAEMVEDGINGYKIDIQHLDKIAEAIELMLNDRNLYVSLAKEAYDTSRNFNESIMIDKVCSILQDQL